jgi:hypothetical protein
LRLSGAKPEKASLIAEISLLFYGRVAVMYSVQPQGFTVPELAKRQEP